MDTKWVLSIESKVDDSLSSLGKKKAYKKKMLLHGRSLKVHVCLHLVQKMRQEERGDNSSKSVPRISGLNVIHLQEDRFVIRSVVAGIFNFLQFVGVVDI